MPAVTTSPTRRAALVAVLIGVAAAVAMLVDGPTAAVSVLVGAAIVTVFTLGGRLPLLLAPALPRGASFLVLGVNYVFRIVLLLVAFVALRDASWIDATALGVTIIGGALVWNIFQIQAHLTAPIPDLPPVPETPESSGSPEEPEASAVPKAPDESEVAPEKAEKVASSPGDPR